jgi:hypothetical protein
MLDYNFQSSWVVDNYVGCKNVIYFVIEYDMNEVIPCFMTIFEWLHLILKIKSITLVDRFVFEGEEDETSMFGA